MDEKLQIINDSVNEIRDILGVECANISDLPGLIRNWGVSGGEGGGAGYTTVFAFSGENYPAIPTASMLNLETGLLDDLDVEWSQTEFKKASTYSLRSSSDDVANWVSFAIFDPLGMIKTPWSTPVNLKGNRGVDGAQGADGKDGAPGEKGETGSQGPQGEKGEKGEKGDKGDPGISGTDGTRFEFIYKRVADTTVSVSKPNTNEQTDKFVPTDEGWSADPQGVSDNLQVEYVCQREKVNKVWQDWTEPTIWAMYGVMGRDGNGIEYIYQLTKDESTWPTDLPVSDLYNDESHIDWDNYNGWTDDPQSVTQAMAVCWVGIRKQYYDSETGKQLWGPYEGPTIWTKYGRDGKEGGGRTIFVYTSTETRYPEIEVTAPQGGTWNTDTNELEDLVGTNGYEWETNPPSKENNKGYIWQSVASFSSAGAIIGTWSDPFCITGINGENGTDGSSIEFIYRLIPNKDNYKVLRNYYKTIKDSGSGYLANTGTDVVPEKIDVLTAEELENSGFSPSSWDVIDSGDDDYREDWNGKYTITNTNWTDFPSGIDGEEYLIEVVCTRTKDLTTDKWSEWSLPNPWAVWGEDGTDGDGVEYIFMVTPKYDAEGNEITAESPLLVIPTYQQYKAYDEANGTNYAELYQQLEFTPGTTVPSILGEGDWFDEPQDVGNEQPIEWVAIRKRGDNNLWGDFCAAKKWASWSTSSSFKTSYVFTRTNEDISGATLTGGRYDYPYPDKTISSGGNELNLVWEDTVPPGSENIWMSLRTFSSTDENPDDEDSVDPTWSAPCLMMDRADFQVEFSAGLKDDEGNVDRVTIPHPDSLNDYYTADTTAKKDVFEDNWRNADNQKNWNWKDSVVNAEWMITSTLKDGSWTDWSVSRIKGEKGDAGDNGTSFTIKGKGVLSCATEASSMLTNGEFIYCIDNGKMYKWNGSAYEEFEGKDGYAIVIEGHLYAWDGDEWIDCGEIVGPAGESAYLYLAFSDDASVLEKDDDVEIDLTQKSGKYIGYKISNTVVSKTLLQVSSTYDKWTKWTGDDGFGYEQIFLLTKETSEIDYDRGPLVPATESDPSYDYLPAIDSAYTSVAKGINGKWMDHPESPTSEYPFCWVATRSNTGTNAWNWRGTEDSDGNMRASLYTRYVKPGENAVHMELSDDNLAVPIESDGTVDPQFVGDVTVYLYDGITLIDDASLVKYYYSFDNSTWTKFTDPTIEFSASVLNTIGNTIYFKVEYNNNTYYKNCKVTKKEASYNLVASKTVLRRDLSTGYLVEEDKSISVDVKKWNPVDNIWENLAGVVWASIYTLDSPTQPKYSEANIDTNSSKATFDLSEYPNMTSVRFYITKDQQSDGEEIAFEDIGVIANGEDGAAHEYIYYCCDVDYISGGLDNPTPSDTTGDYQNPDWHDASYNGISWTDVPSGVSSSKKYEYVAERKKKSGVWEAFSNPVLWAKYGEKGATGDPGNPGDSGESTLVAQLSNPTGIIQYTSGGGWLQTTVTTHLTVLYGTSAIDCGIVGIESIEIDGIAETDIDAYIHLSEEENDTTHVKTLTFTLGDSVKLGSHRISIVLNFKPSNISTILRETMTIITQTAGGESVTAVDLGNDMVWYGLDTTLTTTVRAWYGTQSCDITNVEVSNSSYSTLNNALTYSNGVVSLDTSKLPDDEVGPWEATTNSIELSVTYTLPSGTTKTDTVLWTIGRTSHPIPTFSYITPTSLDSRTTGSFKIEIKGQKWERDYDIYNPSLEVIDPSGASNKITLNADYTSYAYPIGDFGTYTFNLYYSLDNVNRYLADTETIPYIEDGDNALFYQIDANNRFIKKNSSGIVTVPTTGLIKPLVYKYDGSTKYGPLTWDEVDEAGYAVYGKVNTLGALSAVSETTFTDGYDVKTNTVINQLVFYLFEKGVTPDHTVNPTNWYDYTEIDVISDGAKGDSGNSGPVIYPAGEYTAGTPYTGNAQKAPYVYVKGTTSNEYYIAYGTPTSAPDSSALDSITALDWSNPTNEWVKMESFAAIYSDIGVFNHALVGKWVFHGDYMFSQEGIGGTGGSDYMIDPSEDGTSYDMYISPAEAIAAGAFIPNICFNAVTGEASVSAGNAVFNPNGTVSITGKQASINIAVAPTGTSEFDYSTKMNKDGFSYSKTQASTTTDNNMSFVVGPWTDYGGNSESGIRLLKGAVNQSATEFLIGNSGLQLNTYLGGEKTTAIKANENGCYIGDFVISDGGLDYTTDSDTYFRIMPDGLFAMSNGNYFGHSSCCALSAATQKGMLTCPIDRGKTENSVVPAFQVQAGSSEYAIWSNGGMFAGLRTRTRVVTSSTTLYDFDFSVYVTKSGCTLTLPSSPNDGQEYIVESIYGVIFSSSKTILDHSTTGSYDSTSYKGVLRLKYYADASIWTLAKLA